MKRVMVTITVKKDDFDLTLEFLKGNNIGFEIQPYYRIKVWMKEDNLGQLFYLGRFVGQNKRRGLFGIF